MNIVVLGPQGSGKSTQAKLLAGFLQVPFTSSGDICRALEKLDSDLGHRVKSFMSRGLLVPDEDVIAAFKEEFARPEYQNGAIVDGFPRNTFEAEHSPFPVSKAIYLRVSKEVSIQRMELRQRPDDTPELIRVHLDVYYKETEPVLDFYRQQGLLIEVNGEQSIDAIFAEIKLALAK